ncbi:hypothetical protein [Kumtagia ephedrae]|jgi:hypothetical protein|uniref:Spore coat protein U domain-containing protein n=1 Tax=Kumtagia ephedrae TaxID=2116701 RepID=A0A2P7SF47_9HYPH|nr:hypothetical protein [Mesorhizobium ephedrae]PSJ61122.1 hypothetical protein C7I84_10530 [Mesorhizobium ephedrae]
MRPSAWLFLLILASAPAHAQIDNQGNCNANIVGSGNYITVNCQAGGTTAAQTATLIITRDFQNIVLSDTINPGFVDFYNSYFSLTVNDETVVHANFASQFDEQVLRLEKGEHVYKMAVYLQYLNGVTAGTSCSGILNVQASAPIMPRVQIVSNNFTGQISPVTCWFQIRP